MRSISFFATLAGFQLTANIGYAQRVDPAVFDYNQSTSIDLVVVSRKDRDDHFLIDAHFASPDGGRVPAYIWVPKETGPHAGIVLMHGMPGIRGNVRGLATRYVRSGAVVISISAPFARPTLRDNTLRFDERDAEEQVQLMKDLRRAVDVLQAREDVDPNRIGYAGVSYGGAMGGLLAGIERRIKAFALVVGDGGLIAHFTGPEDANGALARLGKGRRERWLAAMGPIEPMIWVSGAAPAELLFQNGEIDRLVPPADGRAYQQAGSEPKTTMWYSSGHRLPDEAWDDQAEWFAERIGTRAHPGD